MELQKIQTKLQAAVVPVGAVLNLYHVHSTSDFLVFLSFFLSFFVSLLCCITLVFFCFYLSIFYNTGLWIVESFSALPFASSFFLLPCSFVCYPLFLFCWLLSIREKPMVFHTIRMVKTKVKENRWSFKATKRKRWGRALKFMYTIYCSQKKENKKLSKTFSKCFFCLCNSLCEASK